MQCYAINILMDKSDSKEAPQQLSSTFVQLINQKEKEMREKIAHSVIKKKHLLKIEEENEEKARTKEKEILRKINRSIDIKNKNIQKAKAKYHQRAQYEKQKAKEHKRRQQDELQENWEKSKQLAAQHPHRRNYSNSVSITLPAQKEQITPQKPGQRVSTRVRISARLPSIEETNREDAMRQKMRRSESERRNELSRIQGVSETLEKSGRVEKKIEEQRQAQGEKLAQINKKLEKIQQTRLKKQKMQRQKQRKIHDILEYKASQLRENSSLNRSQDSPYLEKRKNQSKRLKTLQREISLSSKNELFKKWEEENKMRQQTLFQQRLEKGEVYLQSMRSKSLKNKLIKDIQFSTIEKKLYLERIKLDKLSLKSHSGSRLEAN